MSICPYCNVAFANSNFESYIFTGESINEDKSKRSAHLVEGSYCPSCNNLILYLKVGVAEFVNHEDEYNGGYGSWELVQINKQEIICPKDYDFELSEDVPDDYKKEFSEAFSVLRCSPKASAALSRRILQKFLKEEYHINKSNLVQQIDEFIKIKDIPEYLANSVDAIRNIGNFAAHPLKSKNTGEIIEVEKGEAEWTLEVLKELFHYKFIQPKKLAQRINNLNVKLAELGKRPMKQR